MCACAQNAITSHKEVIYMLSITQGYGYAQKIGKGKVSLPTKVLLSHLELFPYQNLWHYQ